MAFVFPTGVSDGYVWWWGDGIRSFHYRAADNTWVHPAGTALPGNRFTNPAMQINDQNGMTDGTNVAGLIMAEQLFTYFTFAGAGGSYRGQRVLSPTPGGSQYRARITCSVASSAAALAPGDWLVMRADLEASKMTDMQWGDNVAFDPKFAVVRFGWRSPAGTYSFGLRNFGQSEAYTWPFTITPAQANKDTVQIVIIPPNYWEVWPTGNTYWAGCYWTIINANMVVDDYEWLDSGMISGSGLTNTFMRTAGNVVELFDIGWYIDPNATGIPPEFEVPHFEDDQKDCQRYWYKVFASRGVVNAATTTSRLQSVHPVPMRTTPALSLNGAALRAYDGTTAPNSTAVANAASSAQHIDMNVTHTALVVGRRGGILVDSVETNYIGATARL